jgi:predicted amidophosphoribosyltransferase
VFDALRDLVFPVACLGCSRARVALCECCVPPENGLTFSIGATLVRALGPYDGLLRRAIVRMKDGERAYLDAFAALIATRLPPRSALVPLPTTAHRRAARGFDQSVVIAERVAAATGVPALMLLKKRGSPQHGRRREERLRGPEFVLDGRDLPEAVTLLDDVCTTGSTIRAAVAELTAAGVRVDGTIVVARTPETPHRAGRLWRPER